MDTWGNMGMKAGLTLLAVAFLALGLCRSSFSYTVVTEGEHHTCDEVQLQRDLKVFKDPTIFLPSLAMMYQDPVRAWNDLIRENPLMTTVKGTVHLMILGPATEFKNFGAIARIYEVAEPRLIHQKGKKNVPILPVMFCGEDAYRNSLGFVIEEDYLNAQKVDLTPGHMPPSTYPNPIPKLSRNRVMPPPASGATDIN